MVALKVPQLYSPLILQLPYKGANAVNHMDKRSGTKTSARRRLFSCRRISSSRYYHCEAWRMLSERMVYLPTVGQTRAISSIPIVC
ncbi:hypothetical protein TNCT_510431 [Trichonephila clavata]|uniref:Uncharacterized protein n=1 Tax=Trichonephila clavata TaxID=2740835 RepID=A0A8X6KGT4_TRICU|nr:hypothetical protein TNCT_510431 [Trichonephila clavata]